jgi:malate dehydrogenase (oxaloacetate-decarboxylating)
VVDIPVFHDDQHGTAVVVLAALLNALRIVRKEVGDLKTVVCGVGAAGTATIKILRAVGVARIVAVDEHGILAPGRPAPMDAMKTWVARETNPGDQRGTLADAVEGADVFIGVSVPGVLGVKDLQRMARDPIVFAMANPVPEIMPEDAAPHVRVMATGRSDYPNQINNVLCFPGFFRGLLDCRAPRITDEMKIAAAGAIAAIVSRGELNEEYVIPSVFNKRVVPAVARAVMEAAHKAGVARRRKPGAHH